MIDSRKSMNPLEIYSKIVKINPMNNKVYSLADEVASGQLFAAVIGDIAKYCVTYRAWIIYDGCVWVKDEKDVLIEKLAMMFARAFRKYVDDSVNVEMTDTQKKYFTYVIRLGDRAKRLKMIDDARAFVRIKWESLDKDKALFNCKNGTLNLETLEFRDHEASDFLSKCANVNYDPEATSPEWLKFMSDIMCGDMEKVEYLQRCLGYSLTCDVSQEEMYICYGSTTRNGKSTMLETIGNIFGDYGEVMNPETIAEKKKDGSRASPDIVSLAGSRFVRCSEPPKKMLFNASLVKVMTGGEKLKARQLYEGDPREFYPVFHIWMNTNYLPIIGDATVFSSDRVKVITFDKHFSYEEQDRHLKQKFQSEQQKSAILNWMLQGLANYRVKETVPPESVKKASQEYKDLQDKLGMFMDECLLPGIGFNLKLGEVYLIYKEWCKDNGYGVESKSTFTADVKLKNIYGKYGTVDGVTVRNIIRDYHYTNEARIFLDRVNNNRFY